MLSVIRHHYTHCQCFVVSKTTASLICASWLYKYFAPRRHFSFPSPFSFDHHFLALVYSDAWCSLLWALFMSCSDSILRVIGGNCRHLIWIMKAVIILYSWKFLWGRISRFSWWIGKLWELNLWNKSLHTHSRNPTCTTGWGAWPLWLFDWLNWSQ